MSTFEMKLEDFSGILIFVVCNQNDFYVVIGCSEVSCH